MIYRIQNLLMTQVKLPDGRWVIARPINWRYRTLLERLRDAWAVFIGRADAVTFEDQ